MKKIILLIFALTNYAFSQNTAKVEKSIFGIQATLIGISVNNEMRLSNQISLRSEVGLDGALFWGARTKGTGFYLIPDLVIEPRWYYNLEKRVSKGKSIKKNSGNFLTPSIVYVPDLFVISSDKSITGVVPRIALIPKWGIKRTIGDHFTYEVGTGIGYVHYLNNYYNKSSDVIFDIHFKIGYTF